MQVSSINVNKNNYTGFKSTYPVVHWVAETNGSYAPIADIEIIKKLQGKIVRMLNKSLSDLNKPMNVTEQRSRAYIGMSDIDYRNKPIVRSFYNKIVGQPDKFIPISYLISGKHVDIFNDILAKHIGKAKKQSIQQFATPYSSETLETIKRYNDCGLYFVNDPALRIKDKNNMTYILHTKFEILRNKLGKIKDYRFVDMMFLPERGPRNPLER